MSKVVYNDETCSSSEALNRYIAYVADCGAFPGKHAARVMV